MATTPPVAHTLWHQSPHAYSLVCVDEGAKEMEAAAGSCCSSDACPQRRVRPAAAIAVVALTLVVVITTVPSVVVSC